jgi:RNA polymerase sigma-70 factor (ECF subfamily)
LQTLPEAQREALILVGAGGFAYEEAADICGVAVGTIKSRVARGRAALELLINQGALPRRIQADLGGSAAMSDILGQVDSLSGR